LELAKAITDPANPLTARVFVNRVWKHHFGLGLVRTASNFGALGERPTHPELLDHLATQFVRSGWSIKSLHRAIVLSATYRQTSATVDERNREVDPENRLVWRMNRRRLEVEAWRDAMLAPAGTLDRSLGGRSPPRRATTPSASGWRSCASTAGRRRTAKSAWGSRSSPRPPTTRNCRGGNSTRKPFWRRTSSCTWIEI